MQQNTLNAPLIVVTQSFVYPIFVISVVRQPCSCTRNPCPTMKDNLMQPLPTAHDPWNIATPSHRSTTQEKELITELISPNTCADICARGIYATHCYPKFK